MNIEINEKAPAVSKQNIRIHAPIEKVWSVLTSINEWPSWQSAVTEARLKGTLAEGTEFVWKAGGLTFHSKIHTCDQYHSFGWTGKTIGAQAIHNWKFEAKENGVIVSVEESLQGIFASLMKKKFQKSLTDGMAKNLDELKVACEK
ncbi:MAG TPA: SRPBCC family protein [Chitinophagaceae bacterium]|nr:SRPBCC family protein [Chitinophagaceae bacterium]